MMDRDPAISPKPFNCADQATPTWVQRAAVCADLLAAMFPAKGAVMSLADVGCGDQKLHGSLHERGLSVIYTGYDLLPQAPEVRRFDVRCDTLPPGHDVVVMLGVIEYLSDVSGAIGRLASSVPFLVLSHVIRQEASYNQAELAELGWINHLSEEELESMLAASGFAISDRRFSPDGRTLLVASVSREHGKSA